MIKNGYAALITVLIISIISVTIATSVVLSSVTEGQIALSGYHRQTALNIVNSCIEDALIRYNRNQTWPSNIFLPIGSCQLTVNHHAGSSWQITVTSSSIQNYQKSIQFYFTEGTPPTMTRWEEI